MDIIKDIGKINKNSFTIPIVWCILLELTKMEITYLAQSKNQCMQQYAGMHGNKKNIKDNKKHNLFFVNSGIVDDKT